MDSAGNPGGGPILDYTVTSSPGSKTCTATATSCTVTGLVNGTSYTFTVKARNAGGQGPASAASNAVVPSGPPPVGSDYHPVNPVRVQDSRPASRSARTPRPGRRAPRARCRSPVSRAAASRPMPWRWW
ncbi:MAG: fibronectin type III domain-containing protein [Acidimicrobiales bacterium]